MANNNNDLTVNIKATFDKSNTGDFKSEVTKAVEDAAKSVKAIEIKANTQSARDSMQKFTSYLSKLSNAKDGFTTLKIHANTKDAEKAINDLQSKLKDLKVSFDTSKLGNQLNVALRDLNKDDSLKKVKLGTDTAKLLRDINNAINIINSDSSLKKLKLGVDVNYLQQQLNKAVRGLDTTIKVNTKLETTSRTSETKGTVTTNKTSKEEAQEYQSLFSKRAASIANLDRAYQEFGRNSKEVSAALREFAAASKDVRKFGRDTGVLSLNKVKSDIERQLGAGLTTDFTKNWLRMEYDKVLKDIDTLNRQLKPEKYEKAEDDARVKAYNEEYKIRQAIASAQSKADKDAERAYKERERVLQYEQRVRYALAKKGLSGGLTAEEIQNIKEANQATTALSSQFARLRGEALKAGNALNQATNPKDVERLRAEFQKAIQALVNYQRATRGLTKGGEAQLVEKLAVGNIKEQTEAYKVLVEWIKKAVQAQRDLDVTTGRKLPRKSNDTDLMSWFNNMDIGRAVSGMAYAARGELNAVQAFGNLLSNLSKVSGVVGIMVKGLGALALAGLAVYGVVNTVISAFSNLTGMLGRVANVIYDVLRPGIELYKTRQTAELAIAAAISSRATENGKEIPFDRSMNISKEMMERVIADAAMSAFNPQELIDALRGTLPLALGKGWNLAQAYDVTKGVASVAKVINLAPNQVLQELRDILQGTISARSSQVAGATGITSEELKEAEAQGRLYEYIQEHLAKFTVALERYSTTLAGALDRLSETWALGMESVFQKIAPVANSLINEFIDSFIGVYKDSEGNILRNPADFYTTDETTGEKVYKEAGFEWSEYIQSFGDSLVDLIKFIAPIIDEILAFVQELTGKDDAIKAVVEMIKIAIRVTVSLGEFILSFAMGTIEAMNLMEAPISVLISGFIKLGETFVHLVGIGHFMSAAFVEIASTLLQASQMLMVGDIKGLKELPSTISNKIDKFSANYEALTKLGENINTPIATSFAELFGIDKQSLQGKSGIVTELVERALNQAKDGKPTKEIDWKQILGTAKDENKNNLADLRKAMQAAIEDIKQALKDALSQLKDLAEQNDLAYQQGYKSIEDYFTQKAEIEAEEARLKVEALQEEIALVQALDTGGDAGAEYQKQRDLVKLNGEMKIEQRNLNKKSEQQVELLSQINRTLNNKTFQQGIVSGSSSGGSSIGNKVAQEAINRLGMPTAYGGDGTFSVDCSSLNMVVNGEAGIEIPRTADEQKRQHDEMQTFHDLQEVLDGIYIPKPGDSVYFRAGDTEDSYDGIGHVEIVKAFRDGILETISGGNYGAGVLEKERELGDYEMAGFGSVAELAQKLGVLNADAQEATESVNQIEGQMPQVYNKLAMEYNKMVKEGQKQLIDVQKEYAKTLNDPELLKAINLAEVEATMKEKIAIARKRFERIPAIADTLEKLLPISQLKAEVSALVDNANMRIKIIEHDAMAMNKYLREKTVLYPQAIEKYFSYFYGKDGLYSVGGEMDRLMQIADEYKKGGQIGLFHETMTKIDELRSKFTSMIDSWISEMSNYFDYRRQLVEADSGLTNFVKEERKSQLDKGEARVRAVAYRAEATKLAEEEAILQERIDKAIAEGKDIEGSSIQYEMQRVELAKQHAERQAEVNEMLGKQKTLWQETMDAANQALEDGLYKFMTDYVNTAESIGEAFRNMAIDILKDLQKFFAKKAITDLMHVITGTPNEQYYAPERVTNSFIADNTLETVQQLVQANSYLAQIAGQQGTQIAQDQSNAVIEQTHDTNQEAIQQQELMHEQNVDMTTQRMEAEDKRHNMMEESGMSGGSGSTAISGAVSPFTTGITKGAGNTGLTNHNFIANFMNHPMFGGILDFANSIFGSALGQLAGIGFAIDSFINGDRKEQLLATIYIELQLIYQTLVSILTNIATMGTMFYNSGFGYSTGGYISGKGTSTSDSIPAMLSNGEYVIKADAVKRYGLNFLDAVNSGHFTRMRTVIPRFADGGYVGDALQDTARGMTDFAKNIGTNVSMDNNISIALCRDEQEAIREWAKSPSGGQKFLVDFAKGNGRVFSRFNR